MSDETEFDLSSIPLPSEPPVVDELSAKEEIDLSSGKAQKYAQRTLVRDLQRQVARLEEKEASLEKQLHELRSCEVELARMQTKDGLLQVVVVVCACAFAVGTMMTASKTDWISMAGYCLAVIGVVIQTLIGISNPRGSIRQA